MRWLRSQVARLPSLARSRSRGAAETSGASICLGGVHGLRFFAKTPTVPAGIPENGGGLGARLTTAAATPTAAPPSGSQPSAKTDGQEEARAEHCCALSRGPPGVISAAFRAQSPNLRFAPLMDLAFGPHEECAHSSPLVAYHLEQATEATSSSSRLVSALTGDGSCRSLALCRMQQKGGAAGCVRRARLPAPLAGCRRKQSSIDGDPSFSIHLSTGIEIGRAQL
jgi:hypothetical protein